MPEMKQFGEKFFLEPNNSVQFGDELIVTLTSLTIEQIAESPVEGDYPEGVGIVVSLKLEAEGEKTDMEFELLSKPYSSTTKKEWKRFTVNIQDAEEKGATILINKEES